MNKKLIQLLLNQGGVTAIDPNTLPNQVAIWDFSNPANVQTSSGNLDGATDLSGNGNNAVLSANKPAYFSSGGQNNKGYIDLGASGEFLKTGLNGVSTSPFTIYLVIKLPNVYTENSVLVEYDAGLLALLTRDTCLGFNSKITDTLFCDYTSAGLASFDGSHIGYGESSMPARRDVEMVVRFSVLKKSTFSAGNDGSILQIDTEPYLDYSALATATDLNITKISSRYPNARVYEIRVLTGIPSYSNDLLMRQALMSKYALSQPAKTLLMLGDSHTAGTQTGTPGTPFAKSLIINSKANVWNYAVGGTAIHALSPGYDLESFYLNFNKSVFSGCNAFFCYGTNDANNMHGYDLATWKASYKSIINLFIAAGFSPSKIIIATPPWSTGTYVAGAGIAFSLFCSTIRDIATETGVVLCDFAQAHIDAGQDCNTVPGTTDHIHMDGAMETTCYNTLYPLIV